MKLAYVYQRVSGGIHSETTMGQLKEFLTSNQIDKTCILVQNVLLDYVKRQNMKKTKNAREVTNSFFFFNGKVPGG